MYLADTQTLISGAISTTNKYRHAFLVSKRRVLEERTKNILAHKNLTLINIKRFYLCLKSRSNHLTKRACTGWPQTQLAPATSGASDIPTEIRQTSNSTLCTLRSYGRWGSEKIPWNHVTVGLRCQCVGQTSSRGLSSTKGKT